MLDHEQARKLIDFKGITLPVIAVSVASLEPETLHAAASALFGGQSFFEGEPALLDLSRLDDEAPADWLRAKDIIEAHGLRVIGVRGGSEALRQSAGAAGLPTFSYLEVKARRSPDPAPSGVPERAPETAPDVATESATARATARATALAVEQTPEPAPVAAPAAAVSVAARVVDRPLRSGQQVYARGGDLVVLAAVNAGAEVIADGSIHVYAPLRGRALAGASGAADARIFTTRFEAELVSIAGVYRTFDTAIGRDLAGKPVQVRLIESVAEATDGEPGQQASTLSIEALPIS